MGQLYKLDFTNGKSYVGIAFKSAQQRFGDHRYGARHNRQNLLYHAWRKYGEPTLKILATVENSLLHEMEIRAIAAYKTVSPHGYNLTSGGAGLFNPPPEIRAKMIASHIGKSHSLETRAKMSAAHSNPSAETRAKKSAAQKGKTISLEHRAAISRAHKGRIISPEQRAKISATLQGTKLSPDRLARLRILRASAEWRENMSIAKTGIRPSLETRLKMSEMQRQRWARRKAIQLQQQEAV